MQVVREPPAALLQAEPDFLDDLRIRRDRLLRLGRVRNPHRGHVDQDDQRRMRQRSLRLLQAVERQFVWMTALVMAHLSW